MSCRSMSICQYQRTEKSALVASNAHILLFHHDAVDQMPQALVRVLLGRLGVLVVLQAELPEEALRVECLFAQRDGSFGLCGRVELVEQDEQGRRHRQGGRERIEVGIVVGRGGRERSQGGGGLGSLGDDIAQRLSRREGLDDGIVKAAVAEVDESDTATRSESVHARFAASIRCPSRRWLPTAAGTAAPTITAQEA